MPRPRQLDPVELIDAHASRPLVQELPDGDFRAAFMALVTWGSTTTFRRSLMAASRFPLGDDLPAFLLVNQLAHAGMARPTDLADALDTGRSNVSKIIRRLEDASLVFRAADPDDERSVIVGLTPDGRDVGRRILEAGTRATFPDALDVTKAEQEVFRELLTRVARSLGVVGSS